MRQNPILQQLLVDTGFEQMWIFVANWGLPHQEGTIPPGDCGGTGKPANLGERQEENKVVYKHSRTEEEEVLNEYGGYWAGGEDRHKVRMRYWI